MAKTSSARLNAEDFARLPNDGFRYEIIAGELYMSPSPKARHQYLLGELYYRLRADRAPAHRDPASTTTPAAVPSRERPMW